MSGGSFNYAYAKIDRIIDDLADNDDDTGVIDRLCVQLRALSKVLHAIELCWSGDLSTERWVEITCEWVDGHRYIYFSERELEELIDAKVCNFIPKVVRETIRSDSP